MSRGYLCIAQNSDGVDYLRMAYLQALSCKLTQSSVRNFSVIVDKETADHVTVSHREVFDKVIIFKNNLAENSKVKQQNESQVFNCSPYKETIKTEADMLFTTDMSWMWNIYSQFVMNFTQTVYTYNHKVITNRSQRKLFDDSFLPNIYSAWTYFSYDLQSKKFYDTMRSIMDDWDWYRDEYLINCRYETPRTDEVYAIAARIMNMPLDNIKFGFVHMKSQLQGVRISDWTKELYTEIHDDFGVVLGFHRQTKPLHYHIKTFVTDELIDRYEYGFKKQLLG